MKRVLVIGLTGLPGAGKTSIALLMKERLPHAVKIVSLGDPIKAFSAESRGYPVELTQSTEGKKSSPPILKGRTVREVLGEDAQTFRKLRGPIAHVDIALAPVLGHSPAIVIVDDLRTQDEIQRLHEHFPGAFFVVRVHHWWNVYGDGSETPPAAWAANIEGQLEAEDLEHLMVKHVAPRLGGLKEATNSIMSFFQTPILDVCKHIYPPT